MKAMRLHEFGRLEALREDEVAAPRAAAGQVVVRVAASSINPVDWKIAEGRLSGFIDFKLPFTPGSDFAGVVTELGEGVTGFAVGDRVYGATRVDTGGAFAELMAVPAALVAAAPASVSLATAAAVPLGALTAWAAVVLEEYGDVRPGQRVLIHGGAGGVGVFAVQLARWRGARVIATASAGKLALLRSLGVDEAVDYQAVPFEDAVGAVDAVIDLVGGDLPARSLPLIRPGGRLVTALPFADPAVAVSPVVRASYVPGYRDQAALTRITELIDAGVVRVVVSEEVPLARAAEALAKNREGHVAGKIVLTVA